MSVPADFASALTPRECELLAALARHAGTHKLVARELGLGIWTVRDYSKRLRRKFGARTTTELIVRYSRMNDTNTSQEPDAPAAVQVRITGYRQLSQAEQDLINAIKAKGNELGELVEQLRAAPGLDQRWVSIGATDLQTGLMALVRGVAQPASF